MLTYSDSDLESLLDPSALIAELRAAFAQGFNRVRMPNRLQLDIGNATIIVMPCAIVGEPEYGVKIVSVAPARSEGTIKATYMLLDSNRGDTIAMLAANYLTDIRTAAVTAIATELLSPPKVQTLGIFGTGRQAAAHLALLPRVRSFKRILVCGSSAAKARNFVDRMRARYSLDIEPADAATCASKSDVICTCTTSTVPLFHGNLIRPGTHLNLIGAFRPHVREVDSELIRRSLVFVDTWEGAFSEAGDILVPLHAGEIQRHHVCGDLHELIARKSPGRTAEADITIFKSVGCALEDLVAAKLAIQAAQRKMTSSS